MVDEINYLKKQATTIINLYNSNKYEDVIAKSSVLIKNYPNQIIFYNAKALSLSAIGKYREALVILRKALMESPNDINVLNNLGLINTYMNKNKTAREYYVKSISLNSQFIDALVNLANLNVKEDRIDEAKKQLEEALLISKSPEKNEIINIGLGHLFQQTGHLEKSVQYFNTVKKINPQNLIADREISIMHKYKNEDDPHLVEMEKKLSLTNNLTLIKRLSFALAKAHEELKNYNISFDYLSRANEIANKEIGYDFNKDKKIFTNIINLFKNFKKKDIALETDKKIIFIVGMPRSGTTLAEQIISSHRDIYGAGELNFLTDAVDKFLMSDNEFIESSIEQIGYEKFKQVQNYYLEEINIFPQQKKGITDKAPLNFRWIGFIKLLFPNSKIIHCVREPMDICFSNYKNAFSGSSLGFSYNLNNLGNFFNLYEDLMKFWNEIFVGDIYPLNYEKLINNQELETKNLLKYCELEWDENCMKPHKNKKIVATASAAQVRSPIYKTSIKNWENYSAQLKNLKKIISN